MPIPDYQSLMLPVLSASLDGEIRIGDLVERLAEKLALTPEERAELLTSGRQTVFGNRVHWAKTYLSKAGLLEGTRRGYFKITPRGLQVVESKPPRIDVKFLGQFDEFKEFIERSRLAQGAAKDQNPAAPANIRDMAAQPPNEIMLAAHRQIESALAQDLLDRIRIAPPDFFERLIVNLLLSMGFAVPPPRLAARLAAAATTELMAWLTKMHSGSTGFTFRPNAMALATTLALARYGISSEASTATKLLRGSL